MKSSCFFAVFIFSIGLASSGFSQEKIRVATFNVDASPPIGSPLAYDTTIGIQDPLSCRGIIILSHQKPIILCSVDWLGIANSAQTEFKQAFAEAAGTIPERVAIHTIHQHDAPRCDFSSENHLAKHGEPGKKYDIPFCRTVIKNASNAIRQAIKNSSLVTHLGLGQGKVDKVASNRRILGEDGKVAVTRFTATKDPKVRAMPIGTVDPFLKSVSFWNRKKCIAVLTFYATHPQSYYRTGKANPDFPGMARNARQTQTSIPHIHFNGAGGNIGAGKWNDGSVKNRDILAKRVENGMKLAFETTQKTPIQPETLQWTTTRIQMPLGKSLTEAKQLIVLENKKETLANKLSAAKHLSWIRRTNSHDGVPISCLKINRSKTLLVPGELFVEYQLAAQKMDPGSFVLMAAYGEYGMGYIGTAISYSQGGYESSSRASRVGPGSEKVILKAIERLLD
ncbi:MAG: hypothetical protein VX438_12900 [Planctomycetota bacterium]|nr:hypothetical protein [Planctomycetota bacterium]